MSSKQVKIGSKDVAIGMFVSALDRPWKQTPFPIHGFYVRELTELKLLNTHCDYVYIDIQKGIAPDDGLLQQKSLGGYKKPVKFHVASLAPIKVNSAVYMDVQPMAAELLTAENVYSQLLSDVDLVMNQAVNQSLKSVQGIKKTALLFVETVINNPDASLWLIRTDSSKQYPFHYLIRSAMWSLLLGRHFGLPKGELGMLVLGVLLKDVGLAQLNKPALGRSEVQAVDIEQSVLLLKNLSGIPPKVIHVVKTYLERVNGVGIPAGLQGDDIPLLGKLAGIACFYESVIHPFGEAYALSPSKAVSKLYELRGTAFQDDVVGEFIQAIGLYATGTVVKLSTGEVGIVTEQHLQRRLKPNVLLLLNSNGERMKKMAVIDLFEDESRKKKRFDTEKKHTASTEKIDIVQDLSIQDLVIENISLTPDDIKVMIESARKGLAKQLNKKSIFSFWS